MALKLDDRFSPPWWLRHRHLQSALASLPLRRRWIVARAAALSAASRELLLDCGEGVRLQAFDAPQPGQPQARVAALLHGWEGSAESLYVLSLAQQLHARGFQVVRLNLRDHGDTHHLNRELFHSCRLPEVIGALRAIQQHVGGRALHLAGFSLGGNFMLRAAADAGGSALAVARVVAVSPVLDPVATLNALEHGFVAYRRYFVRKWSRSLGLKQRAWPAEYDFTELVRSASLRQMTAALVERFTDFGSLEAYLNGYALVGARLAALAVPATLILSQDDPMIPAADLERLPAQLRIVLTRHGGHCGFVDRVRGPTWAERTAAAELDAAASDTAGRAAEALSPAELRASPRSSPPAVRR